MSWHERRRRNVLASLAEKIFGLLLTIIRALFLYFTATSTAALGVFTAFFGCLSIMLLAVASAAT